MSDFIPGDWITPTIKIVEGIIKMAKNVRQDNFTASTVDAELTERIYNQQEREYQPSITEIVPKESNSEWACYYCGTPQPMKNRKCDSCGGNRHFTRR